MQETEVRSPVWEEPLEKEKAASSSILAWEMPWTEEPWELKFMGLRVWQDWATKQKWQLAYILLTLL